MSTKRTVTVLTLDHGDITIPEPSWCTGHDSDPPELRSDTGHTGVGHQATYQGHELAFAQLVQDPFTKHSDHRVGVLVELGSLADRLDPDELDELAAVIVEYAGTLRHLARQLGTLRAGEGR